MSARPPSRVPQLIVFDLDQCMWSPEMYQLRSKPTVPVLGDLGNGLGEGIVGCNNGNQTVALFPGALLALQELHTLKEFKHTRIAAASSSEEPTYSAACLDLLEILPGVTMRSVFSYFAIGRTKACGNLTSDKRTHFKKIQAESGIDFSEMLFFDDCNWGDHVGKINKAHGVIGQRTPEGLQESEWREALATFAQERGEAEPQGEKKK